MTMMKIKTLTTAALIVAGCASSDYLVPKGQRSSWKPVQDAKVADAKDIPAPKILPETHLAAGFLFEGQGNYEKAIMQYRKAIAVSHEYVEAYHRLGLVLSKVGRHAEAVEAFRRAVELKPAYVMYHNNLGFELMLLNRWAEAESELRTTIELSPKFERARINLGVVMARQGRFDEALETFLQVLPDSDAYYNLGLMYRGQKQYEEAATAFERVLQLDPQFTAASSQLEQIAPFIETRTVRTETTETVTPTSVASIDNDLTTVRPQTNASSEPIVFDPVQARFVSSTDSFEQLASYDLTQSEDTDITDLGPVTSVTSDWYANERWSTPEWDRTIREIDFETPAVTTTDSIDDNAVEPISAFTGESIDTDTMVDEETEGSELSDPTDGIDAFEFFNNGFQVTDNGEAITIKDETVFALELEQALWVARNEMSCWDDMIVQAMTRNQPTISINPDVVLISASEIECFATQESTWEVGTASGADSPKGIQSSTFGSPRERMHD